MAQGQKGVTATATCCICGEKVWVHTGLDGLSYLQDAEEAKCRICEPVTNWKRIKEEEIWGISTRNSKPMELQRSR